MSKLIVLRHPKIIEDEKAIEVVLRLEETSRSTTGTNDNGRRFTVTAVGSRLGPDHRQSIVAATSIAAGDNITKPPATEQRQSSEARRSSRATLETAASEDVNLAVPTRTITDPQYTTHLEAIEEMHPDFPVSLSSQESGNLA